MKYFLAGCLFWGAGVFGMYAVRPNAKWNGTAITVLGRKEKAFLAALLAALILLCVLPMSLTPTWNGEEPGHRNQYEVMAESLLKGHLYMDYDDIDPQLLAMENPYDPAMREALGVSLHWDHAFYNGHYYMYFGVVPVFLVFLPYRLLTGMALTTYHATQVFTALFILGLFRLFYFLAKRFFPSLPWPVYLSLSTAFSLMSVWYIVGVPALYCTAISSGICMEVWSLFFFAKAVWGSSGQWKPVGYGALGSLCGALAFGCRPPVALANLVAVPLLACYLRGKKWGLGLLRQVVLVALPYVLVGGALMAYNYARFETPFEFGQSFQLTIADQSHYGSVLENFDLAVAIKGLFYNFIWAAPLKGEFPYIGYSSVLMNFPLCILGYVTALRRATWQGMRENRLVGFMVALCATPVVITVMDVLMSPLLLERYRSDLYWLVGLFCFMAFGLFCHSLTGPAKRMCGFLLSLIGIATAYQAFFLWCFPADMNYTYYYPKMLERIGRVVCLGFC